MSTLNDPAARKRALIEAAKAAKEAKNSTNVTKEDAALAKKIDLINPAEATNKIRIVFDNSGSMGFPINYGAGMEPKIKQAKKGVVEFLRNCTLNKDAVAVHLLELPYEANEEDVSSGYYYSTPARRVPQIIRDSELTTDLLLLASNVDSDGVYDFGGTPLYECIIKTLETEPKATRLVAFSDGQPTGDRAKKGVAISLANRYKIPIDTVYFGAANDSGAAVMKELAEATGGIYLAFDPAKGVSFADSFKYLSPGKRLMLMNAEFKAKLERGEVK
jgi:hypothetical protein